MKNLFKEKKRIPELDIFRAIVLFYMAFVNSYFALSKQQIQIFSHHGEIMSGGDLIIVYFFLMLGFNIALIGKLKSINFKKIMIYGLKRGLLLIAIGMGLISYQFISFGFKPVIFFKSFLVILGIGLIIMSFLAAIFRCNWEILLAVCLLFSLQMFYFSTELVYSINFLTPYFLLTGIWGYFFGIMYLEKGKFFYKISLIFCLVCFILAGLHIMVFNSIPSRQVLGAPFFLLSWGLIWLLLVLFLKSKISSKNIFQKLFWLRQIGSHPLSFWILQSAVIAFVVVLATIFHYWKNDIIAFFWDFPYRIRMVENHFFAIIASIVVAIVIGFGHWSYVNRFSQKQI